MLRHNNIIVKFLLKKKIHFKHYVCEKLVIFAKKTKNCKLCSEINGLNCQMRYFRIFFRAGGFCSKGLFRYSKDTFLSAENVRISILSIKKDAEININYREMFPAKFKEMFASPPNFLCKFKKKDHNF